MCNEKKKQTEYQIPAEILEAVKQHKSDADSYKAEIQRLERKREISRNSMFALIEDELPELTEENYKVNIDEGTVEIQESGSGLMSALKDLLPNK